MFWSMFERRPMLVSWVMAGSWVTYTLLVLQIMRTGHA